MLVQSFVSVHEVLKCVHSSGSFSVVLSCGAVYNAAQRRSVDEILKCAISKTAVEQYFPVLLFTMLYKVAQALESVDEILNVLEAC